MAKCGDCGKTICNNGADCPFYLNDRCHFCHCHDLDPDDSDYIEIKCWSNSIDAGDARDFVEMGVVGILAGGSITNNAKKILDEADIWYLEDVEPEELERAVEEGEAEWA